MCLINVPPFESFLALLAFNSYQNGSNLQQHFLSELIQYMYTIFIIKSVKKYNERTVVGEDRWSIYVYPRYN